MKQFIFAVAIMATAIGANAQSERYTAAMEKNLTLLDSAKTTTDLQAVSSAFERIGDAEKTQWLPYYYAALAQTNIGWADQKADKDAIGNKAAALAGKGEAIEKNSELCIIRNMAATIQMMVNPQERWQTYGKQANEALAEGMKLDPNNPRLYYLKGMSLFNTPEAFGGGKDKAKVQFEKAMELFNKENPKPLYPRWGKKETEEMLKQCN
ncbi:MAG: hypothetical protein LBE82_12060 [Chitinophagaceae bacterium]|jgi:hypothetical protein|nr:hypothetical protein [Chitinophagaceae bacterium]